MVVAAHVGGAPRVVAPDVTGTPLFGAVTRTVVT